MQNQTLDISWEGILKVALAGVLFYVLFLIRDIVVWFLFALVISVLLEPAIKFFKLCKVPRIIGTIFIYLIVFGIVGLVFYLSAPLFINEIKNLSGQIPAYFERLNPIFTGLKIESLQSIENLTLALTSGLEKISAGVFASLVVFFGGLASTLFIISIAFFLSLQEKGVEQVLRLIVPQKYEDYSLKLFNKCQTKVSGWFGSRVLACFFVALATAIVLLAFKVDYIFTLSLFAGVLNFIPFLGPLITGILLFLFVGAVDSWVKATIIIIAFIIIQQIESGVLSPVLTKKFVGLPPVLVLLAVVMGAKIFGLLGAVFAIPLFGIFYEFIKEFLEKRKEATTEPVQV